MEYSLEYSPDGKMFKRHCKILNKKKKKLHTHCFSEIEEKNFPSQKRLNGIVKF
jgi:hypothetical protein